MALSSEDLRLMAISPVEIGEKEEILPKFIAYIDETSHGCDHTIACGKTLWKLKAQTKEAALLELKRKITPPLEDDEPNYELESVTLYQVSGIANVPLEEWYTEKEQKKSEFKEKAKTEKRRKQYQKLKAEFEKIPRNRTSPFP